MHLALRKLRPKSPAINKKCESLKNSQFAACVKRHQQTCNALHRWGSAPRVVVSEFRVLRRFAQG